MTHPRVAALVCLHLLVAARAAADQPRGATTDETARDEDEDEEEAEDEEEQETTPPAPPPTEDAAARETRAVLGDKRYAFCHDPAYPLTEEEFRTCALVPGATPLCPKFEQACKAGVRARERAIEKKRELKFELPGFGGIGRIVLLAMVALAVAGLLYLLLAGAVKLRARKRTAPEPGPATDAPSQLNQEPSEVERDVERLLARAQARAGAGDFAGALTELHAALLRRLDGDGLVRVHASRTNGDYVRDVRDRAPALLPPVRAVVRGIESVQFGGTPPGPALFESLWGHVVAVARRPLGPALVLLLALALPGCNFLDRGDWNHSPSGNQAVIDLLKRSGHEARERLPSVAKLGPDDKVDALIVLADADVEDEDWKAIAAWLDRRGGLLMVAGGTRKLPAWIEAELVAQGAAAKEPLTVGPGLRGAFDPGKPARVPGTGFVRTAPGHHDVQLLARKDKPYAVELPRDLGRVIVVADDYLFTNVSLLVPGNALAALLLTQDVTGPIEFVGTFTGLVSPNAAASVARGKLAPFLGQLAFFLLILFVGRGAMFGRPRDPRVAPRRAFAEHVRALGTQYARARAARHALAAYAAYAIDKLRERLRAGGRGSLGDLSAAIAARTGRPMGDVARLLLAARDGDSEGTHDGSTAPLAVRRRREAEAALATMRTLGQLVAACGARRTTTSMPVPRQTTPRETTRSRP